MPNVVFSPSGFSSLFSRLCVLPVVLAGLLVPAAAQAQWSTSSYNFGSLAIGASATQFQTLTIPSALTLGGIIVSTQGAVNKDFTNAGGGSCTVGTAYGAGATCTVSVTFTPKLAGTRYGGVVLTDSSGNVIATDYLQGEGLGPQVNFLPGTEITVANSGLNMPGDLVVDGSGNLYFYDVNNNRILKETPSGSSYTQSSVFGGLTNVGGLAVDGAGNFYIAVATDIVKETWNGSSYVQSTIGSGLSNQPNGLSVDSGGNVYVADVYNGRVVKETLSAGTYTQSTILTCGGGGQSCPSSAAVDGNGNVFVTAYDSSQIIKLTPSSGGYTQSAINASLTWPSGIVADGQGNLYIADTLNSRAVKMTLTPSGYVQSTVPSGAIDWPWGVAVDQFGNVYISDTYDERVLKEDLADAPSLSFATTPVGGTSSDSPQTVQVLNYGNESLNFAALSYPADFPEATGDSSSCTSSTSLSANHLCDLPIDFTPLNAGSFLSEDVTLTDNALNVTGAQQLIAVSGATTGTIVATHLSVSAPATVGAGAPFTITVTALDAGGETATGYSGTVNFTSTDGSAVLPAASTLTAGVGTFRVTLKTLGNQTVTATDAANSFTATSGTIDVGATPPGVFPGQSSVNFGSQAIGSPSSAWTLSFSIGAGTTVGSIAVVTQGAPNLDFTNAAGTTCTATTYSSSATCVVNVTFTPRFSGTRYGAVVFSDGSGNLLASGYVQGTGVGPQAIFADTTTGVYLPSTQSSLGSGFIDPQGVAVDGSGNVFVADWSNNGVKEILAAGGYTTVKTLGNWVSSAYGVAVDGGGNVFVADYANNAVKEILAAGGYTTVNTLAQANGNFNCPNGVAVDGSGNVFVADSNNSAVKEILAAGGYTTVITLAVANGNFYAPRGVAVDGSGNVFVADAGAGTNHDAVKEILAAGGYTTVKTLGSGFDIPFGVAVDGSGNVFVSDTGNDAGYTGNNAVKEIVAAGGYTTVKILGSGLSYPRGAAVDGSGNVFVAGTDGDAVWKLDYAVPPSLNFPTSTPVGSTDTTDGTQTVQIQNIGNQPLALTALSYPADFPEASGDAGACASTTSLSAGQECDLPIEFAPETANSVLTEDVTLTDNALNLSGAQQSIGVSGTSTGSIVATHLSVTGPANVGAGVPFTITVTALDAGGGTATGYAGTVSFTSTDGSALLPAASKLTAGMGTFQVTLETLGNQTVTATDVANSFTATSGTIDVGATPPGVFSGQSSVNFGSQAIGSPSGAQTLSFSIGGGTTVGSIAVVTQGAPNLDFTSATGTTCTATTYLSATSCVVNVTFTPRFPGLRMGAVEFFSEANNSGAVLGQVMIYGTGVGPQAVFANTTSGVYLPSAQTNLGSGFSLPIGLAVDASGNVFVADTHNFAVKEIVAVNGSIPASPTIKTLGSGFNYPWSVAVDGAGNIFVGNDLSNGNGAVYEIVAASGYTTVNTLGEFSGPTHVAVDGSGNVFVVGFVGNGAVYEILAAGGYTTVNTLAIGFSHPSGVAVDGSGNVFVSDQGDNTVKEILAAGGYTTVNTLGSGFNSPSGVAVDGSGNVFLGDEGNNAVKEIMAAGGYTKVNTLGSGFSDASGTAVGGNGNVFVADYANSRVVELDYADSPSLSFSTTPQGSVSADSPRTVTVINDGNADLELSAVSYPTDFPEATGDANACTSSASVSSGQQCDLPIEFSPEKIGSPLSEDVTLTDNALNMTGARQSILVSGTSTGSIVATNLSVSAPANAGAGVPFTITVTALDAGGGTATGYSGTVSFTSTDASAVLPAASTLTAGAGTFQVTMNTLGDQTITATDAVNSFTASTGTIDVGATPPGVFPGQTSVNFGSQAIGSPSGAQTLSFSIGAGTTVGSIAVVTQGAPNLDFTQATGTTCTATTYSSGATCVVNVTFTPKFAGLRTGAVVFYSAAGNTGTVLASTSIYGIGSGPQIAYIPSPGITISPVVNGEGLGQPHYAVKDGAGDLFISDFFNNRIVEIPAGGGAAIAFDPIVNGLGLYNPAGLAVDGAGDLFIADGLNARVLEIPVGGGTAIAIDPTVNGVALVFPNEIALDGAGDLFIADGWHERVVEVPADGRTPIAISPVVDGRGLSGYVEGLALDAAGDLFIADSGGSRIVFVPVGGGAPQSYDPVADGVGLNFPNGVAVDAAGDLFIADSYGNRLVEARVGSQTGTAIYQTLNGEALNSPADVWLDQAGNLFLGDYGNNRMVEVVRSQPPAVSFPTATPVGSVDTTDGTQTVQIQNIGNMALDFTALVYPADFPEASGDSIACTGSTSLGVGLTCDLPIEFSPGKAGSPLSEDVMLTDNALNVTGATQSIAVSGTGTTNAATHFSITTTAPVVAGSPFTITVSALNSVGAATTYNGTVSLSSSDPLFVNPGPLTLASGLGQTTVTLKTAGTQTITGTDTTTSSLTGSGSFAVVAGPTASLALSNVPAVAYAYASFPLTVTAFDLYGNQAAGYSGTVKFSSTDPSATLPAATTLAAGTGTFSATLLTPGNQTITVTDTANSSLVATSSRISVMTPYLVVTGANDDAGAAGNCTVQTAPGNGTDAVCSLRDALLKSAAIGSGTITFDATVFAKAQTITLANGALTIPSNTSITGPTTGAGATLTNLLTVNGAGQYTVFTVPSSTAAATLNNLTIANGASPGVGGGGINNQGALTVTNSTFSGNTANGAKGGAIFNSGTLMLANSTFTGNTAHTGYGFGGAIFNLGTLTVSGSTFSGNQSGCGGALFNAATATATLTGDTISGNAGGCASGVDSSGTLSLANTMVSGNAVGNPELRGSYADNGGNQVGISGIKLAPLGNYGGPTGTMVPLPGSPALCAGAGLNAAGATDQRGFPFDPACPSGSVDSGAVQTNYALAFTTEPPVSATAGQALWPAPVVGLTESGVVAAVPTSTVRMTDSAGLLAGTTAANFNDGSAAFGNLVVPSATSNDLLTATLVLTSGVNVTTQSSGVQVNAPAADTLYSPRPGTVLTGPEVTFSWSPAPGATGYSLWMGSTGVGSHNVYDSGERTFTSLKVPGLPTNGETLYVRLYTSFGKRVAHSDYTFVATMKAAITTPAGGSVLGGANVTFVWSASIGASGYSMWLGTGVGLNNLYDSGERTGTSATAKGLPTNGETIYARLYTTYGNATVYADYTYTAQ